LVLNSRIECEKAPQPGEWDTDRAALKTFKQRRSMGKPGHLTGKKGSRKPCLPGPAQGFFAAGANQKQVDMKSLGVRKGGLRPRRQGKGQKEPLFGHQKKKGGKEGPWG